MLTRIFLLSFLFPILFINSLPLTHATENNLTGTWYTATPTPYLVEHTTEHPYGMPLLHQGKKLLKRTLSLQWQLNQDAHGLITGTNHWISYDKNNKKVIEGNESLIGAYKHNHVILTESADDSAHVIFDITHDANKIMGIGYSVSGPKMIAFPFELIRKPTKKLQTNNDDCK
ncbi:hypothetical protein [Shewanella surugensis]|uniref:Lipocalin-like domain-containing protein n=1 Tax=Shewanella surugensis TaxID=212020 RepID=A0ABT0LHV3_9GAMM|nr:hypothetical protein [Shewanella surugensis]MCL1127288.1 hypothetical protein [Shewanella surugensis]